jgi:hypothetical protein
VWRIAQVLIDPGEQNDWEARFRVPLAAARAENRAVVNFDCVVPIGGFSSAAAPESGG